MSQRACPVFGSIVLAILIATPAAHAVCRSPKNICKHIDDCLQRTNKDADQIKEGVRTRNGKVVWAGAEACARDLGRKREWDGWARKCSDLSMSQLLRWRSNSEKSIATATRNSERASRTTYWPNRAFI
jgi:hypothetical protein